MESARKYYCRCCYYAGELEMLSGLALDVYTLICHSWGSKDDATQIFACFQCREFLEEVHCFRDERRRDESGNLDFKPHEVDMIMSSANVGIKTEIIDEDIAMNQIDIQINKIEANTDPETTQRMSETSRESLFVSNVKRSEIDDRNSLNSYKNSMLIERRAIPYIETSKSINGPLKGLGKVHKKNRGKPFKCNECTYEAILSSELKYHILDKHSNEKSFSCDQCDYRSKKKWNVTLHMRKHFPKCEKPFKCNECSYDTFTSGNLKCHILYKHSNQRLFSCDQCDSRFKTKSNLSDHMKTHLANREKPFKCNECSYGAFTSSKLKRHIFHKHSDEKPFSCDHCNSRFKAKSYLSDHMRKHFPKCDKPFKCNECSYDAFILSKLKSHILHKHSDEKPFSCDLCDSRFKTKSNLSDHMNTHLTKRDKPFKCNECSYEALISSKLKYHILHKHSDERPFSCDLCDSRFKTKSNLSEHMRKHFPKCDKPFKCNECSYEALISSKLKYHILHKHSDERPFSCNLCDSRFKTKSNLSIHMKIHLNRDKLSK